MLKVTTYICDDGTTFNSFKEAQNYESTQTVLGKAEEVLRAQHPSIVAKLGPSDLRNLLLTLLLHPDFSLMHLPGKGEGRASR